MTFTFLPAFRTDLLLIGTIGTLQQELQANFIPGLSLFAGKAVTYKKFPAVCLLSITRVKKIFLDL